MNIPIWSDEVFEQRYNEMETKLKGRITELETLVESLYEKIRNKKEGEWEAVVEIENIMCDCGDPSCYRMIEASAMFLILNSDPTDPKFNQSIVFDLPPNYQMFKKVQP